MEPDTQPPEDDPEFLDFEVETAHEAYVRHNRANHARDTEVRQALVHSYQVVERMLEPVQILTESPACDDASGMTHIVAAGQVARLINRAHAALLRHAMHAQASRAFMFDDPAGGLDTTGEQLARSLGISTYKAGKLLGAAAQIYDHLPHTAAALDAGELSLDKAIVLADGLRGVPPHLAHAVESVALSHASVRTVSEIRKDIERLLIELDPDTANELHADASERRRVSRPRSRAHGMALMRMDLTAEQSASIDHALDVAARAALTAGDCRTYHQLRADVLASWAITALQTGAHLTTTCGDPVHIPPTKIAVTVPLEVLARLLPGWDPHRAPAAVLADLYDGDAETAERTAQLLGDGRQILELSRDALGRPVGRTEAAWVEGYGPIAPALGALLAAGGTWQRIITDGPSGVPLDVGRHRYRPPAAIEAAVRARDLACQGPGCDSRARGELDHVIEWHDGGGTSVGNLLVLCKRCHRRKSAAGEYLVAVRPDGSRVWQTPTGTYTSYPARAFRRISHDALPLPFPDAA